MYSKVLNYPSASSTTNVHSRFVATSSATVSSSASISSSTFNYDNLQLDDIMCAVCQSVLNEPVFLPCQHLFCLSCIRGTIESNKLYCPCCRKRFGTWYRNATRANALVHEPLWLEIQKQFGAHLGYDNSSSSSKGLVAQKNKQLYRASSTVQLANPGEIGKEFKNELKRFQKEILEEKTKELSASEQYIINLYKQEGIIDLADNSSHVSVSSATTPDLHDCAAAGEKCSADEHVPSSSGPVAGPSMVRKQPNQLSTANGVKASGSFNHNSPSNGSVISISSTSSAASGVTASSCATSSASGRYSLIKSVAQKIGRSAEMVKQKVQDTILNRLTEVKLQQHQHSINAVDLNKSELCIKPTAVHKLERRGVEGDDADGDDSDSLKSEQNHFIPIVQSMPKSSFSCNTFRRVPTVRPGPSPVKYNATPKKSPYQPLQQNRSTSAFKVVKLQIFSPPPIPFEKTSERSSSVASLKKEIPSSTPRPRGRPRRIKFSPVKSPLKQATEVAERSSAGRTTRSTTCGRPSTIKDIIVSDQQRREQQIEMERRDFEFAQKLQQKLNRACGVMQEIQRQQPGTATRRTGYSLRRRGLNYSDTEKACDKSDSTLFNDSADNNTPNCSSSTTSSEQKAQATRKRKATSSSVENDVPSSSSPTKRMVVQTKTRRQTRQIRMNNDNDSSLDESLDHSEQQQKHACSIPAVRKSTRNKTR
uniref:RING-type E3 ubiquitin transferase n=1 Tax=Anopheles epiroticus TaxID=199890 RepID=A0A182PRP4_9DIPT